MQINHSCDQFFSNVFFKKKFRCVFPKVFGVVFGTLNSVSNNFLQFSESNLIPTIGLGIRYNVNKKERNQVRIDVGYGREGFNFYATASNAF